MQSRSNLKNAAKFYEWPDPPQCVIIIALSDILVGGAPIPPAEVNHKDTAGDRVNSKHNVGPTSCFSEQDVDKHLRISVVSFMLRYDASIS